MARRVGSEQTAAATLIITLRRCCARKSRPDAVSLPFCFDRTELPGSDLHRPRGWPHRPPGNGDRKPPDMCHPHCRRLPGNRSPSRRVRPRRS